MERTYCPESDPKAVDGTGCEWYWDYFYDEWASEPCVQGETTPDPSLGLCMTWIGGDRFAWLPDRYMPYEPQKLAPGHPGSGNGHADG